MNIVFKKYNYFIYLLFVFIVSCTSPSTDKNLNQQWYELLPDCPCIDPDINGVVLNDGWAKDKGNVSKYHKGAKTSYRSYPPVKTQEGWSGQQCCYDFNGKLIVYEQGAGTPDKSSTCSGETNDGFMRLRYVGIVKHYWKDVLPWLKLMKADKENGWKIYNKEWQPSKGINCPE